MSLCPACMKESGLPVPDGVPVGHICGRIDEDKETRALDALAVLAIREPTFNEIVTPDRLLAIAREYLRARMKWREGPWDNAAHAQYHMRRDAFLAACSKPETIIALCERLEVASRPCDPGRNNMTRPLI